jgi:DnaJ-class molecular chaperone
MLKSAWRRACKKHHPDQNNDPRSQAMFILASCAYRYLTGDGSCQESLLQYAENVADNSENDDTPGNDWSHFLWWRDRFFDKPN